MNITKQENGKDIVLILNGWLDTAASPILGEELKKIETANSLTLDFNDVEYIASSGVRQVVAAHKKAKEMGASFCLINVGNEIMSIFELTCLDKKINIKTK